MLVLAGIALPPILLPRLTAYLAVLSVIPGTLRRRLWVVWFYGFSAHASFTSIFVIRWSVSVSATVTAVSEPPVSAVVSVTAITGLQIRCHFRLWPKPEKVVSVGLYTNVLQTTGIRKHIAKRNSVAYSSQRNVSTVRKRLILPTM